jgi:hypothetical protein
MYGGYDPYAKSSAQIIKYCTKFSKTVIIFSSKTTATNTNFYSGSNNIGTFVENSSAVVLDSNNSLSQNECLLPTIATMPILFSSTYCLISITGSRPSFSMMSSTIPNRLPVFSARSYFSFGL